MRRIVLKRRSSDWHACIDGDERLWGCGRSIDEAVGHVIRDHPDRFGLAVEFKDDAATTRALEGR